MSVEEGEVMGNKEQYSRYFDLLFDGCCFYWFTNGEQCGKEHTKTPVKLTGQENWCEDCTDFVSVLEKKG